MQSSQYPYPAVTAEWAASRETDDDVAAAIHAIADETRTPQQIWEAPEPAEMDHVTMAIAEYRRAGIARDDDRPLNWGEELIKIPSGHVARADCPVCRAAGPDGAGSTAHLFSQEEPVTVDQVCEDCQEFVEAGGELGTAIGSVQL